MQNLARILKDLNISLTYDCDLELVTPYALVIVLMIQKYSYYFCYYLLFSISPFFPKLFLFSEQQGVYFLI